MKQIILKNGYQRRQIEWVLENKQWKKHQKDIEEEKLRGMEILPCCSSVTNKISRIHWQGKILIQFPILIQKLNKI